MKTPYLRQAIKRPLFLRGKFSISAMVECAQMFIGQQYLVVKPQAAEFIIIGAVLDIQDRFKR